jgi:integrase
MTRRPRGEGSVYRRADGRWVASLDLGFTPGGKRRRKVLYGRTQPEVREKLRKARNQLLDHGTVAPTAPTVATWMRTWLDEIAAEEVRPTTLPGYRSKVETWIIPVIGRHRLDRLAPEHVRALYRAMRDAGRAESHVRQVHAILKRALKVAVREGKVTRNVAELVNAPSTFVKASEPLTSTEVAAILEAAVGDRLESRWLVALLLGMRQGECLGLTWDRVDLDAGTLTVDRALARIKGRGLVMVPVKSKASNRVVPLEGTVLESLQRRQAAYGAERAAPGFTDLGFVWGQANGRPRDPAADWQAWVDLLARAEVERRRLHDARHAAASALASLDVPVDVRMAILGHSTVSMAMHYTHADAARIREAVALVSRSHRQLEA